MNAVLFFYSTVTSASPWFSVPSSRGVFTAHVFLTNICFSLYSSSWPDMRTTILAPLQHLAKVNPVHVVCDVMLHNTAEFLPSTKSIIFCAFLMRVFISSIWFGMWHISNDSIRHNEEVLCIITFCGNVFFSPLLALKSVYYSRCRQAIYVNFN